MDREEAIDILKKYKKSKISDIYNDIDEVSEAILVLYPKFEYFKHSHKTIFEFLSFLEAISLSSGFGDFGLY